MNTSMLSANAECAVTATTRIARISRAILPALRIFLFALLAWALAFLALVLPFSMVQAAEPRITMANHQAGLREVARVQALLAADARSQDANQAHGTAQSITEDGILAAYRALNDQIAARMPALFLNVPAGFIDIAPQSAGPSLQDVDHVTVPTTDGSLPAIYWVAIGDPTRFDTAGIAARLLATGRPGRYFQAELRGTARTDGWDLYAASLGKEMGLYADAGARRAFLRLELTAAARLVADSGMQNAGWSRRRARTDRSARPGLSGNTGRARPRRTGPRPAIQPGRVPPNVAGSLKAHP